MSATITSKKMSRNFLAGGGQMGALIRAHDWDSSPLGPPETWPQPLKLSVRLLLSTGNPMFIWWGPDLIQFYNDAYCRSIGPERHPSAIGQRGRECWDEIWDIIGPQIQQVMAGEGYTRHENQLVPITRHGRREDVYWTYSYTPIDDPDAPSGVGGILVICTETTEQVLAEQRTKAAEARWRALFNQAPGFLATMKGPDHVFEFANPRYYDLIGHREIIGKPAHEALPEIADQGFLELLDHVYRTGEAHSGFATPLTLINPDTNTEQKVYVDFVYQPIRDADGQITGILADGYDVTQREFASETLREDGRRKDEFLAMLAHELRNPLAPIRNVSEFLLRTTTHDPAMHTIGELLARQASQLTRLVDDLLDISRITQGRVTLRREPMELCSVIELVIESLKEQIEQKQHEVLFDRQGKIFYINGDVTRIVQCVSNVLANAIKYTSSGGRIEIRVTEADGNAVVEVTDNGTGISAEMLPRVFDLFAQANRTLDRSQGGLGIGLSVVSRMVQMHGGEVSAQSPGLGLGSTFQIRLPLIQKPEHPVPEPTAARPAPKRILVVDDNADAADSLSQLLELRGHEIVTAYGAHDALDQVKRFTPDVVLLDIGLPEMDGYEVAQRLRAEQYTGTLVALTGYGQAEDVQKSREAGFDTHFTKPVEFTELERIFED